MTTTTKTGLVAGEDDDEEEWAWDVYTSSWAPRYVFI